MTTLTDEMNRILDEIYAEISKPKPKPGARKSLLLAPFRRAHAIDLLDLLANPMDIVEHADGDPIKGRAERMWRQFGRDVNVRGYVSGDMLHLTGNPAHIEAFSDIALNIPRRA